MNDRTVQLLLNNGADINLCRKTGASPLYTVCEKGHESIGQFLLNNGADIDLPIWCYILKILIFSSVLLLLLKIINALLSCQ